jgi:AcrR family transcriptional regulator
MMDELGPRQRAAQTKRDRTRTALRIAGWQVVEREGWNNLRMEDVAELAGVSAATAYNHYKTKQLLIADIFNMKIEPVLHDVKTHRPQDLDRFMESHLTDLGEAAVYVSGGIDLEQLTAIIVFQNAQDGVPTLFQVLREIIQIGIDRRDFVVPKGVSKSQLADHYTIVLMARIAIRHESAAEAAAHITAEVLSELRT